jgi:DNA-binding protein H-NS
MPLVELEDRELARLRQIERDYPDAANWRKAWGDIINDPDLKMPAWELFKKKNPNVPVPEFDAAHAASKPILEKLAALEKQIADDKDRREKEDSERTERTREQTAKETIAQARRRLKADGWGDEAIGKIEALMQERGIGDYDVAAAYVRSQLPKTVPLNQTYEGRDLNWFNPGDDQPDAKLLMENPRKFKNDMVRKFMQDKANGDLRGWAA